MGAYLRFLLSVGLVVGGCGTALASHGGYVLSSVSGGTYTKNSSVIDDATSGSGYGGSGAVFLPGSAQCTGTMTFVFTWVPADTGDSPPIDAPPLDVAVAVQSYAAGGGVTGCAATDDLGDTPVTTVTDGVTSVVSTGTHYFVRSGGATVTVYVDPESTGTGGVVGYLGTSGGATAWVTVAVEPISVSFTGTVPPPSTGDADADQALPGQEVQANLSVPPATSVTGCT